MSRTLLGLAVALALTAPAYAQSPELNELRAELSRMRQDYEDRIRQLEERLNRVEPAIAAKQPETPAATARADAGRGLHGANVGLVLNARYASLKRDPATYALPGFLLPKEAGPGQRGLALGESELAVEGNIDPYFFGSATLAYATEGAETKTHLEEAYIATTALPHGFTVKGRRFNSRIGYLNEFHRHADDFTDRPLPYPRHARQPRRRRGVYADDGLQVRWVAPTETFFELGAELFRGELPGRGRAARRPGCTRCSRTSAVTSARSTAGAPGCRRLTPRPMRARAARTASPAPAAYGSPTSSGNGRRTATRARASSSCRRSISGATSRACSTARATPARKTGWYAQAVYRFVPRWSAGLREDRLSSNNRGGTVAGSTLDSLGHTPRRTSLMLDYAPSEFSRLRLQYNRDQSQAEADNQWYLQYIMSLGAHRAHSY